MTAHASSHLLSLYSKLLFTADSPILSQRHGAAAINALCGYLEQGCVSSIPNVRTLCFDFDTWQSVFELFIRRSESNKPKPMRQLLLTLMNIRAMNPDESVRAAAKQLASKRTIDLIIREAECSWGKPAFQILEYFLSKAILKASEIVDLVAVYSGSRIPQRIPASSHSKSNIGESQACNATKALAAQEFISRILSWIRYPDTASAAGRLISIFVKSLQAHSKELAIDVGSELSICMDPIKKALKEQPDLLNAIRKHVLPDLFQLQSKDTLAFIQSMPLQDLSQGNTSRLSDADIEMYLLSVEVIGDIRSCPGFGASYNTALYLSSVKISKLTSTRFEQRSRIMASKRARRRWH